MPCFLPCILKAHARSLAAGLVATALSIASLSAQAVGLNDTGQTLCYSDAGAVVPCHIAGQDGRYGRDAAAKAGTLAKIGAGAAGFDYTKVANDGSDLPASATLGSNPTDWACTRDNLTGLTWEMKTTTNTDLHYSGHLYAWYSTASNNGGNAGSLGTNTCNGTLVAYANQCNTANFATAVNAANLCGHNDWRMPTNKELLSLVNAAVSNPAIDVNYFPNTQSSIYWSATNQASDSTQAWGVLFNIGYTFKRAKTFSQWVRLVRGGP